MPPKIDMSREEAAEREIGVTRVSSGVKILLVALFLVSLVAVPLIQSTRGFGLKWSGEEKESSPGLWSRLAALNHHLKTAALNIEKSLEEDSFLTKTFLPPVQTLAFRLFGLGNEKVYVAPDGWLHYRPDVDYVLETGRASPFEAPTKALAQLNADLQSRGIRLIVLPVPAKPVVESLPSGTPQDSHNQFLAELRRNGIEVFDPTNLLIEWRRATGRSQYLKTDSHWTPESMEAVAGLLAEKVLPAPLPSSLKKDPPLPVKNTGDLAVMLQLLPEANAAMAETAKIHPVRLANGTAWHPDPSSDVLLLGDSFTNIYSTPDLGWGEGAGLAEHLSLNLGRPVDRIAINAGGSLTVRQSLARNPARLDGKKIVIYQFAVRELTSGDWRSVRIPATTPASEKNKYATTHNGRVNANTPLPAPGSVPYKDAVISLHLVEINGDPKAEALVFIRGMTANVPTKASKIQTGDRVSLAVVPWETVEDKFGSITRIELDSPAAELDSIYWADSQ
jgi:alginate O-acetyltransferase complex protein AlgJ